METKPKKRGRKPKIKVDETSEQVQDKKDVDKMLNTAYTKNQSMRETLAKVWGLDEGKSPFQKEEEKPLTKTMTGQKPTTVKVNPKIEEK